VRAPREPSHALYFKRLHRDLDSMHCLGIAREGRSPGGARDAALSFEPGDVTDRRQPDL
jgi:hypothetical protein